MVEGYIIVTGVIFAIWLYALVRQTQRDVSPDQAVSPRPVVPVNLTDSDEAVIMAEGRGRIVYANGPARDWFGLNGGAPNLTLMAQMVQPTDSLHDLLASDGHATFRLGQRQVEAVSHSIPGPEGPKMVIVMRELTGGVAQVYTDYDPLRAMSILDDISRATGATLDLDHTAEAVIQSLIHAISFDAAEITLWYEEAEILRPIAYSVARTQTGSLSQPEQRDNVTYRVGEGYTGWIALYRQPLLINDVTGRTDVFPKAFRGDFQSYLGVPLSVGDQFVGTLELTHHERNGFDQQDLMLVRAVGGQIASAIQAARLYRDQRARVAELDGLQQIAEAMGQLGELSSLYGQLTQRIATLLDVELCGILIYDETQQMFRSQPPFYGVPDALIAHYQLAVVPGTELYAIWHHQPWWYTNDAHSPLIEAMGFGELISAVDIDGLALMPMIIGTQRVGLLLVANKGDGQGFSEDDMRALMSYASQAAVVAENARLYHEEQRRTHELGGLQQIAQAIGSLRSPVELYSQITARIAALMNVQMCGVLLYDPKEHALISQRPFYGMDDEEAISFYQLRSPPGSPIARLWLERETWFSNNLRIDPLAYDTDLAALASTIGINKTAMATLSAGGNRLGIIQASNKLDGADFTEDDARLLFIFAGQAAILIDNARLYREMQRRTHEAEGLRAVTEIVSQAVPDQETVEQVLIAVANLLEANVVTIALVEEETGELVTDPDHVWGASLNSPYRIDAYASGFSESVLVARRAFVNNDLRNDADVLEVYRPLFNQLGLRNIVQVPLIIHERSIGELIVGNRASDVEFSPADAQLLTAIGTQIAAMVDRMRLYQATDQDLRARVQELYALSRVGHELSQTLELERILDVIRQEALRSTDASAASVVLLADRSDWETPDEPVIEQRFGEGRSLRKLAPIERTAILRNDVLVVHDYSDSEFDAVPSKARSALVVPVTYGEQVMGLIHLYSTTPGVFNRRVVDFALALTDHATVAITNARRYQDQLQINERLRTRAERMGRIFELGEMFRQGSDLPEMLEEVAHSIQETVGFNVVLISLLDERAGVLWRTAQAGLPLAAFEEMRQTTPPLEQAQGLMQDQYRISNSYFLPAERAEALRADLPIYKVLEERMGEGPRAWDPDDLLIVPLYGSNRRLLGIITVDEPRSGRRPDLATIEALEIFSNQAAFAIENYRLIQHIREEAEATRRERDRLAQLHLVASEIQGAPDVPSRLQIVANGIHEAGWGHVIITLHDEHLEPTALIQSGYTPEQAMVLSDNVLPGSVWRAWINDLRFHELKLGAGYYLRYDDPWVREHPLKGKEIIPPRVDSETWHPMDMVYLPLVGQDQKRIIGMIGMDDPVDGRVPTEASLKPFELFASQAAAAIETTRLYMETVRAAEQELRLNEVMEAVSGAFSSEGVIQAVGRGLQQMVPFTRMSLALYNDEHKQFNVLRADIDLDSTVTVSPVDALAVEGTAVGLAFNEMLARLYRLEQEIAPRENFADLRAWYDSGERSTLLVPMIAGGQAVGVLRLGSELENAFSFNENLEMIQRLANLSAVALENARLFTQASERATQLDSQARRLTFVNRVSAQLAQTLDLQEIYRVVLHELQSIFQVAYAGLVLFENEKTGLLVLDTHPSFKGEGITRLQLIGNQSIEHVRATHKPLVSEDAQHDPLFEQAWDLFKQRGTVSLMIVPLMAGDTVLGTIGLDATERRVFTEAEIELAETVAGQASLAIEKARLYDETLGLTIFNQAVVESIQQGIVALDQDLYIRRVNRFMTDRYGWTTAAVDRKLFEYRPDYAQFLREPIAVALALAEPQVRYEVEHHDESGTLSTRNYYIYPMIEEKSVTGIVLLLEDVTERARLEADLNLRAVQMAALSEVSGRVTSTLEPDEVIDVVLDALNRVIPYDGVSLWLRSPEREELRIVAARGYQDPDATGIDELIGLTVEIPYSPLFREMAEKARVINATNVATDARFPYGSEAVYKNWLGAPLISKGEIIGVLALEKREPNSYEILHEQLALTFANQAAVALDNARLFQETRARASALDEQAQRLALLNRVSLALAQTLDLENIYEIALRETAIALGAVEGAAIQIDNENNLGLVVVEYPRGEAPPEKAYTLANHEAFERVRDSLIPLVVDHTSPNPSSASLQPMLRRDDVQTSLLVPLVVGGEVIGLLRLDAVGEARPFTTDQIELAQTITSQAATAVQNAGLFEQGQVRTRELETLFESAQATAVTLDLNEVVRRVTGQMLAAVGADACTVFLWDDVNNLLEVRGEISAREDALASEQPGNVYELTDYPMREKALRDRELIIVRADDKNLPPGERALLERHNAVSRMLVPLVVNEISIGLVEIETLDPAHHFKVETVRLARTLASQAAISIENARLQTETRRTVEELYIINDMSGALSSANNLQELLSVVDAQLPSLTDAQVIYVALHDQATHTLSFPLATSVRDNRLLDAPSRSLGKDEFSLIVRQKAPLLLAGANLDQVRRSLGIKSIMPEALCFLGVPLFAGEDVVGVLAIRDDEDPLAFSHNDQRILNTVGAQLGVAIQSTRLFTQTLQLAEELDQRVRERTAELEQERQHITTLYAITTELATSLDMDRLLNRSLEMVANAVGANQGALLAVDPIQDRLIFRAHFGWPANAAGTVGDITLNLNEGLAGWVIQNRRSVIVDNVQEDPRWLRLDETDDIPRAAMVAPIESSEDTLGVVMLYSDKVGAFHEDHLRLVTAAANQVANAMNNAELYSLIRDQAERLGAMLREQQVESTKSGSILDSVADGVMVSDESGNVIVFNSAASNILKIPAQNVLNRPASQISGLYGAGQTRWAESIEHWIKDPTVYQPGTYLEERITLEDERVISVRLSPVYIGDQFLGTVSIFRDITREVEVDRLKSEFVATVSHELRTPMTSIKGYADLLLLGAAGDISEQQQRFLETIKQNADRLSILVNDLLDISRIDQGRMELRFSTVEVEDLLKASAGHVRGRGEDEKRPMNVEIQLPEGQHLTVWGDYDKVAQILTNLADNAYNYTPPGGTITLSAHRSDNLDSVILQVSDTGIGIGPEVGDRVYERFYRGDEVHDLVMDTPGTGLGLSIVRELVEVHHGQIWYESEVGKGTTFYVELPVKDDIQVPRRESQHA